MQTFDKLNLGIMKKTYITPKMKAVSGTYIRKS